MLQRLPIRLKLILLAGVPVLGALFLATLISRDAQQRAQSAAALGTIEDLARLSAQMSSLVHELQFERNEVALRLGLKTPDAPELQRRFAQTDEARQQLTLFLSQRQVATLPARLARDLKAAQAQLTGLPEQRQEVLSGKRELNAWLDRYEATNRSLISATAALAQLSDDGELMRAISALVTVMEIKERSSQEHALLSYVFAVSEFPPGSFKELVTLTTQEADYISVLEVNASDAVNKRFRAIWSSPDFARAGTLARIALDTIDDQFGVDPLEWSKIQGDKISRSRDLVIALNEAVKAAALAKVAAAKAAVRLSYTLGGSVIVLSALLAGWIAHGVSRSVGNLSEAARQVRENKDFRVRAVKNSDDELGALTDAFNDMLVGIEVRDHELTQHRDNLERLVAERTAALLQRNQAMRLVLDNVEQGLATIEPSGRLAVERSRAFDAWFGDGNSEDPFANRLAQHDPELNAWFKLGWAQVTEGLFPADVALDQLPRKIEALGRHYQLTYKAVLEDEDRLQGVLLVVTDVTEQMERLQRDAEQRELISSFEHLMRDRAGTLEFMQECETLLSVIKGASSDRASTLRALHTLKGNAGTFGVTSVAEAAHRLEDELADSPEQLESRQWVDLDRAWRAFTDRLGRLIGTEPEPVLEVALSELQALVSAAEGGLSPSKLVELLLRLRSERALVRLRRVAEQAKSLAERLGKSPVEVRVQAHGDVRFDRERWAPFWSAFVHPLRNALDHGIEPPEQRMAAGKPLAGKLELSVRGDFEWLTIELADDDELR